MGNCMLFQTITKLDRGSRYINRIKSTRKLKEAGGEHVGLIWLKSMNEPDHNALWRFFDRNKKAMQEFFKKSVRVAVNLKRVGMVLHGADGPHNS
jgi:hypothetical protein